jgi:hypothetical protein
MHLLITLPRLLDTSKVVTATDGPTHLFVMSDKALVRPLSNIWAYSREYSKNPSITTDSYWKEPTVRPSVMPLYDRFTPPSVIYDNPGYIRKCGHALPASVWEAWQLQHRLLHAQNSWPTWYTSGDGRSIDQVKLPLRNIDNRPHQDQRSS